MLTGRPCADDTVGQPWLDVEAFQVVALDVVLPDVSSDDWLGESWPLDWLGWPGRHDWSDWADWPDRPD